LRDYGTATWEGGDKNCDHQVESNVKEYEGDWKRPSREEFGNIGVLLKCQVCEKEFKGRMGNKFCSTKCLNTLSNEEREKSQSERVDHCKKCGAKRIDQQLGLEETPEEYVEKMVEVFSEVKRVLKDDGTVWLNLGDSYMSSGGASRHHGYTDPKYMNGRKIEHFEPQAYPHKTIKPKDLVGIPWRVAFALQADGWYLRQDIIWHKPNPMPESVTDRCTKSHEYIFLLTKSAKYYYDADAVKEDSVDDESYKGRRPRNQGNMNLSDPDNYKFHGSVGENGKLKSGQTYPKRNKRSVWTITTKPYKDAHFAVFPPKLPELCIKAGSKEGDIVLDPFFGSGTTGWVAQRLSRKWIGIELNADYIKIAEKRFAQKELF